MKGKYLITTDDYFIAPDGKEYKSVWGDVQILNDNVLGVKANRNAVNWYAKVGDVIIAGCQIHFAIKCGKPNTGSVKQYEDKETPSKIYIAE